MDNGDDGGDGDGDGRPCPQCGGNDRVIKVLTSGPHLAAGTQPPRSFDFDLDVDVDNSSQIVGSKDDFDNICAAQYETHLSWSKLTHMTKI